MATDQWRTTESGIRRSQWREQWPGKLGVVKEGGLADLLLVNGNPLKNLALLEKADQNIDLIMKDGRIFKNELR